MAEYQAERGVREYSSITFSKIRHAALCQRLRLSVATHNAKYYVLLLKVLKRRANDRIALTIFEGRWIGFCKSIFQFRRTGTTRSRVHIRSPQP
jgi:hypothetical protein